MLKSMTGYGVAIAENDQLSVMVEIKSLNSKFLDLSLRLAKEYADKELEIRNTLNTSIERGKVSLVIEVKQKTEVKPKVILNKDLIKFYYQELIDAAEKAGASKEDLFRSALTMPGVVDTDSQLNDNEAEWQFIMNVLQDAIKKFETFRLAEGKVLASKFLEYLGKIETLLKNVEAYDPQRIEAIRERIKTHVSEYSASEMDKGRFEQELIYYIEKLDISEEKVRLKTHIEYFKETMISSDNNGKKLGFIAQEIGREINTIGSKANDASIQKCVVEMKDELEKIKEQGMNVL
ncbi:MAG TPA: YicC/YloC family endoribonuclease [Cytophagaceae bacterium]|jgi:uncharacterized protein (TIGR00255 family)|nr:YicC/YloC family endoribonuclease [Cytophagaceae bacterium]